MLGGQVRFAKFIGKLLALSFLVRIKLVTIVGEIFLILGRPFKVARRTELPVMLAQVCLCNDRCWVPLLPDCFVFDRSLRLHRLGISAVAELEVR